MNLQEIKSAVEAGKNVYHGSGLYKVIKDSKNQWLIKCTSNGYCIGLTHKDGVTLNGQESEFFTV